MGKKHSITRSILVFEFNPVKDLFGISSDNDYHDDDEDRYGSGDYAYNDDEGDDLEEGSGDDTDVDDVRVSLVEDADYILEKYGPGVVEGCGVTLTQTKDKVVFVITGGKNSDGQTLGKVLKTELVNINGSPKLGSINQFLPELNFKRRQHGCYKVFRILYKSW